MYPSSRSKVVDTNGHMAKVFGWMSVGILLTGIVAGWMSNQTQAMQFLTSSPYIYFGVMTAEVALVMWLAVGIESMEPFVAKALFLFYAALNGVTLSVIAMVYTQESIQTAFLVTSFGFIGLSLVGYVTKKDLTSLGTFCYIGLFGLLGIIIISIFVPSLRSNPLISIGAILIFAGLTAYDVQEIKNGAKDDKTAIIGALNLYLNFINIFIHVLQILGLRDDD